MNERMQHELQGNRSPENMICWKLDGAEGESKLMVHLLHSTTKMKKTQVGISTWKHVLSRYHRPTQNTN